MELVGHRIPSLHIEPHHLYQDPSHVDGALHFQNQNITSYSVAFLSPEPVTIYLSSVEMSQLRTEDDSLDWKEKYFK